MTKPYALLLHPFKFLGGANALTKELTSVGQLLMQNGYDVAYRTEQLDKAGYKLADFNEIWLSCFGLKQDLLTKAEIDLFTQLATFNGPIVYICNDPSFFGVQSAYMPKVYYADLNVAFAGKKQWSPSFVAKDLSTWSVEPKRAFNMPIWQNQFRRAKASPNWEQKELDLIYVGHARSEYRQARAKAFMADCNLATGSFSLEIANAPRHTNFGKIPYVVTEHFLQKANCTIVLGDESYGCLAPEPHRLLQGWFYGQLTFLDADCWDEDEFALAHGEWIRAMFVNNSAEIKQKLAYWSTATKNWLLNQQEIALANCTKC